MTQEENLWAPGVEHSEGLTRWTRWVRISVKIIGGKDMENGEGKTQKGKCEKSGGFGEGATQK